MSQDTNDWRDLGLISMGSLTNVHKVRLTSGIECAVQYFPLPAKADATDETARSQLSQRTMYDKIFTLIGSLQVQHPNLVRILDVKKLPLEAKMAKFMELFDGHPLKELIKSDAATGGLPDDQISHFSKQICSALDYLHSKEVIHRNLNSENVLVSEKHGVVKLVDFGISVQLEDGSTHYSTSCQSGIPNYMAPELLQLETKSIVYSRGTDIWALGCLVYEMATGGRPYAECKTIGAITRAISDNGAQELPEGCSHMLKSFYAACTNKDRRERDSASRLLEHPFLATPLARSRVF